MTVHFAVIIADPNFSEDPYPLLHNHPYTSHPKLLLLHCKPTLPSYTAHTQFTSYTTVTPISAWGLKHVSAYNVCCAYIKVCIWPLVVHLIDLIHYYCTIFLILIIIIIITTCRSITDFAVLLCFLLYPDDHFFSIQSI